MNMLPSSESAPSLILNSEFVKEVVTENKMLGNQSPNSLKTSVLFMKGQEQFPIYCPACRKTYTFSEGKAHLDVHALNNRSFFSAKKQSLTTDSEPKKAIMYPLIEPLEFNAKDLRESRRSTKVNSIAHELMENNKVAQQVVYVQSKATQTSNHPPLQVGSNSLNLFNCFDNALAPGKMNVWKDLVSRNSVVTPKRQLTEWEKQRVRKI